MSARDRVREFASGFDATEFASKLRGVLNGEPWFEKRGTDRIRRRPADDDQRRRHRRYQRYLGAGFLVLLGVALWWPTVAAVGVIGCASAAIGVATVRGRYYCDWLCPRGGLLDGYVRLLSRGKRTPAWFKHPLIRAGVAVVAFGALGAGLVAAWGGSCDYGGPVPDDAGCEYPRCRLTGGRLPPAGVVSDLPGWDDRSRGPPRGRGARP